MPFVILIPAGYVVAYVVFAGLIVLVAGVVRLIWWSLRTMLRLLRRLAPRHPLTRLPDPSNPPPARRLRLGERG